MSFWCGIIVVIKLVVLNLRSLLRKVLVVCKQIFIALCLVIFQITVLLIRTAL